MIRSDPYWGAGEWFVVVLWKAATLGMAAITGYVGITGHNWGLHIVGIVYVPLALAAFIFTQPGV